VTRLRRSPSLVLTFEGDDVVGFDCLWQTRARLAARALRLLAALRDWSDPAALFHAEDRRATADTLLALLDASFVLVEGTVGADVAARFERDWVWGPMAAAFHFGIKDPDYQGPVAATAILEHRVATRPQPPLLTSNAGLPTAALPRAPASPTLDLLHERRSSRTFDPDAPLRLAALADCLFAGLGVVGWMATGIPGEGLLPLKMSPSGGARNPYEAYVVARAVDGLAPGAYHYDGLAGDLGLVRPGVPDLAALLGGQPWFARAGAVIVLVAHFERSAWKYMHATGLRVVLIEAGHIAQNLLLAATAHDLAAAPTCALSDRGLEELLGLDRVAQAAVHAVALGARALP